MKIPRLMALTLMTVMTAACHFPVTTGETNNMERYRLAVDSWPGAHIDELLAAWPRSWLASRAEPGGDGAYTFVRTEEYFRQAEQYYDHSHNEWVDKTPAGTELLICETKFTIAPDGIITGVRPGSDHCGQMAPPPARLSAR